MTVLCVNSSVVYADITAADAAESGIDYGVPTRFEQTGTSSSAVVFSSTDYPSSFVYIATSGEETDGTTGVGAQCTGLITTSVTSGVIENLRTGRITFMLALNHANINLVSDGGGGDAYLFGTLAASSINCIRYNCSEGCRANSTNDNYIETNCTVVDATGFGVLRPRAVDSVSLNTNSAAYLQVGASSSNYWADDGTGSNAIAETVKTDIFENYATGDYRIKASSSVGVAGAGAFINSSSGISIAVDSIGNLQSISNVTLTQGNILTVNGLTSNQSISQPSFTQASVLSVGGIETGQTLSSVALSVAGSLLIDDLSSLQSESIVSFIQGNLLLVDGLTSTSEISESIIDTGLNLIVDSISNIQNITKSGLTQHNILLTDPISNTQFIGVVSFGGEGQDVGTVTAGFADDKYSVKYGVINITVKFKE